APTWIGRTCPVSCHVGAFRRSYCFWLPTAGGHTSGGCHQQCHCQSRKSRGLYFPATGDVLFTRLHRARASSGSNQPRRRTSLTANPFTSSKIKKHTEHLRKGKIMNSHNNLASKALAVVVRKA